MLFAVGCVTVLGDKSTTQRFPWAKPGTVTEFPANRAENSRLSRVCGIFLPSAPKTVTHPLRLRWASEGSPDYWRAFAGAPPGLTAVASTETPGSPKPTRAPWAS